MEGPPPLMNPLKLYDSIRSFFTGGWVDTNNIVPHIGEYFSGMMNNSLLSGDAIHHQAPAHHLFAGCYSR